MKIYGHPWSINSRKTLMTLAEKGALATTPMVLIMIPKGEQKHPAHIARHPWGKVPVLEEDDGTTVLETRAINAYIDRRFGGPPSLVPSESRDLARLDQWINVADSYFVPHAHAMVVELLFRKYLGGEKNDALVETSRSHVKTALDVMDRELEHPHRPYLAGPTFSLADIHWMPYLEYLTHIGEASLVHDRKNVAAWWSRVSERPTWQKVARSGPQPYEPGMTADVVERMYR